MPTVPLTAHSYSQNHLRTRYSLIAPRENVQGTPTPTSLLFADFLENTQSLFDKAFCFSGKILLCITTLIYA